MKTHRKIVICILMLLTMNPFAFAGEKRDLIVKFMRMTRVYERLDRSLVSYENEYQKMIPNLNPKYWETEIKPILITYKSAVIEEWILIYDAYLSDEEALEIVTFYESPFGRKLLKMNAVLAPKFDKAWFDLASKLNDTLIDKLKQDGFYR